MVLPWKKAHGLSTEIQGLGVQGNTDGCRIVDFYEDFVLINHWHKHYSNIDEMIPKLCHTGFRYSISERFRRPCSKIGPQDLGQFKVWVAEWLAPQLHIGQIV
jgi:hypothetical protein